MGIQGRRASNSACQRAAGRTGTLKTALAALMQQKEVIFTQASNRANIDLLERGRVKSGGVQLPVGMIPAFSTISITVRSSARVRCTTVLRIPHMARRKAREGAIAPFNAMITLHRVVLVELPLPLERESSSALRILLLRIQAPW
jgi:hypothetical protein